MPLQPGAAEALVVERVVVLGRGGAGKSVFAQELGRLTDLPVIEVDKHFWDPELKPMRTGLWRERQVALAKELRWVIDGDLGPYDDLEPRLRRADAVVVFDFPFWHCAWRAARRGRERADFWWWVLRWRHTSRPLIMAAIAQWATEANVTVFTKRGEVTTWLLAEAATRRDS